MKKQYMQPSVEEIKITTTALLAGSQLGLGTPGNANNAESRGGRWEDEEEEEW